jgi:hypothetical protein
MPGDSGVLVVTRVRSITTKGTRGRGCNGHPAFPTPSTGREINANLGRIAPRDRGRVFDDCECAAIFVERSDDSLQAPSFRDAPSGAGPESRDSGFDASHRPGMTVMGLRAEPLCADPLARNDGAGSLRIEVMRSSTARRETHSSCPDLIRASINLHNRFSRRRWITGSSPVTISIGVTVPGDALRSATAQENVAATLPSPDSSITTLSPAVSQIVFTRLPVSTISPAARPLPSEAR